MFVSNLLAVKRKEGTSITVLCMEEFENVSLCYQAFL